MKKYLQLLILCTISLNNHSILQAAAPGPATAGHEKEKQAKAHGIAPAVPLWMQPINPEEQPWAAQPAPGEATIHFDRENMSHEPFQSSTRWAEGHWATSSIPSQDLHQGRHPFPVVSTQNWEPYKSEFLKRLAMIESTLTYNGTHTPAESRLARGEGVGRGSYSDRFSSITWPEGYGQHYIKRFNVLPSRAFYRYVMAYPFRSRPTKGIGTLWFASINKPISEGMLDFMLTIFPELLEGTAVGKLTGLNYAAYNGKVDAVRWLLEHKANVHTRNDLGSTPLINAPTDNDAISQEIIKLLLQYGADINAQNLRGTSPLIMAAALNKPKSVQLLLANKADINLRDKEGKTALDDAQYNAAIMSILLPYVSAEVRKKYEDANPELAQRIKEYLAKQHKTTQSGDLPPVATKTGH